MFTLLRSLTLRLAWDFFVFVAAASASIFAGYQLLGQKASTEEQVAYLLNPVTKADTPSERSAKVEGLELAAKIEEMTAASVASAPEAAPRAESTVGAESAAQSKERTAAIFDQLPQQGQGQVQTCEILRMQLADHQDEIHRVEDRLRALMMTREANATASQTKLEAAVVGMASAVDGLDQKIWILLVAMGVVGVDKVPGLKRHFGKGERRTGDG